MGDEDSCAPKANDISSSNVPDVGHIAYVFIDAPTTFRVRKVSDDHFRGIGEGVAAVVDRNQHAALAKPNEVASLVPCNICDKTRMFGGEPPSCVLSKVLGDKDGLGFEAVRQDRDSIETKADDRSEAGVGGWYWGLRELI